MRLKPTMDGQLREFLETWIKARAAVIAKNEARIKEHWRRYGKGNPQLSKVVEEHLRKKIERAKHEMKMLQILHERALP